LVQPFSSFLLSAFSLLVHLALVEALFNFFFLTFLFNCSFDYAFRCATPITLVVVEGLGQCITTIIDSHYIITTSRMRDIVYHIARASPPPNY
jgi:hypothetical protein